MSYTDVVPFLQSILITGETLKWLLSFRTAVEWKISFLTLREEKVLINFWGFSDPSQTLCLFSRKQKYLSVVTCIKKHSCP